MPGEPEVKWAWWCIYGEELMKLLRRAHDGEDPDMLYAEAYANSKVEKPGETDGV